MKSDMSIQEAEQVFMDDFNELDDWFLQYEYLLQLTCDMQPLAEEEKTEENRIPGCQSTVWLIMTCEDGKLQIRADSPALIIKGMLGVVVSLLDGRAPEEIEGYRMRFIEETALKEQLSTDRFRGLSSVVAAIQKYASANCTLSSAA